MHYSLASSKLNKWGSRLTVVPAEPQLADFST